MKLIDCTQDTPSPDFTPFDTSGIDTSEEALAYGDDAGAAIHNLNKIREKAAELEALIHTMYLKSYNDPLKVYTGSAIPFDEVLTEHTDLQNEAETFLANVDAALAKFKKLAKDCDDLSEELRAEERSNSRYGDYASQVRDTYYSTR